MDVNIDISKYQTKQMLLKLLLCTVYISFICLILGQVQAIADFNYTLHEIMYLPVNIAIFIVPIEFIAFIYYWIRWRSEIREEQEKKQYWRIKRVLTICLLLLPLCYFTYLTNGIHTSGIYGNVAKHQVDNKFFIDIAGKEIRCSKNEYNLIDHEKEYLISFDWNKLFPAKGRLQYIDLSDKSKVEKNSGTNRLLDPIENNSSEINSFQDYRLTSDLNNDGQMDLVSLLYVNTLVLEINDKTIDLGNIDSRTYEDLFNHDLYKEFPTIFKVIMGDDKQKYILLAYPIMCANTDAIEYRTYLIIYDDKGISLLWNGEPPEYDYKYADNKIKFKYLDTHREIVGDITAKVEKMKSEYLRIAPMTIEEFFNGQLIILVHQLNCIDYDGDGNDEIVTVYTIENEQLAWRLACMYTVWEIHDGKIQARNGIIPVNNSVESGILTKIMENGYFNIGELQNFIKQNYPNENENYSIEALLFNAIYKIQKTLVSFNCD